MAKRKSIPFKKVVEAVDLLDACSFLGIELKKQGRTYRGQCPECDNDRMAVTPGEGFKCHRCDLKGDVIALVKAHEGLNGMYEAASLLVEEFGLDFGNSTVPKRRNSTVRKSRNSTGTVTNSGNSTVPKERDEQSDLSAKLEAVMDRLQPDHPDIEDLGLSEETCLHFGAGYDKRGQNRGRLAVPIHDASGELLGFAGILINGSGPEIIYPDNVDIDRHIFNMHRQSEGSVSIVEDILSVLLNYEDGVTNCVCRMELPTNVVPLRKSA